MSNSIVRVVAGVIGLGLAALPHTASAQPYEDGAPAYRPYVRQDFRPLNGDFGPANGRSGYASRVADVPREDRHAAYDEEDVQPRPRHRYRPYPGFEGPEAYGGPERWSRWEGPPSWRREWRRERYLVDGDRLDRHRADEHRPLVVTARPAYAPSAPSYRDSADVGCTVQTTEHEIEGGHETVTRRSCFTR